ncbi:MAG: DUF1573 domain-containing protein [Prevotellaceae bacterium]|jgi:hypothetical protein|nr:DUF1573 domain-containing protein [Prevotellaceae bacterium]
MKNLLKTALLITALSFALTTVSAQTGKIVFDNPSHNFGPNVNQKGGGVTHRFVFTNQGDAPITIQNVKPSCGCTTPAWTKEPVAPGAQGFVDATYNPSSVGYFSKSLEVTNNGDPQTITLIISGEVVAEPKVEETQPELIEPKVEETPDVQEEK